MMSNLNSGSFRSLRLAFGGAAALLLGVACVPLENLDGYGDAGSTPVMEPGNNGGSGGSAGAGGAAGSGGGGSGGSSGEKLDAAPAPMGKQDAAPTPVGKQDAAPQPQKKDAAPAPQVKMDAAPAPQVKLDAAPTPPPPPQKLDAAAPPPPPAPAVPTCEGVAVFMAKCNFCHIGTAVGKVDLVADAVFERLKGVKAQGGCKERAYIETTLGADGKAQGVLFDRISGTTCGPQMPPGPALDPKVVECIRDWATAKLKSP